METFHSGSASEDCSWKVGTKELESSGNTRFVIFLKIMLLQPPEITESFSTLEVEGMDIPLTVERDIRRFIRNDLPR